MAILGIFLFAANYLAYAALTICLILDYCLWQHRKIALSWKVLIVLVLPQSIAIAMIAMVWNPFGTAFGSYVSKNSLLDRLELFFWNLRDLNSAEFLVAPLVLAAFFLAWKNNDQLLTRMLVALLAYAGFVSLVSPQTLSNTTVADIRYLVPLIPLGIALETLVIIRLTKGFRVLWLAVALLAFETNVINGGPFLSSGARSTIAEFFRELVSPPPEPYSLAADWVAQNVKLGQSVVVLPDYMVYPLMFKAPHAVYGWQFKNVDKPSFQDLGEIHFEGRVPPDFFIVFGPIVSDFLKASSQWKEAGWRYEHFATINSYWKDLYRPELFWRTFSPVLQFDPNWEAIQIFRRIYEEPR